MSRRYDDGVWIWGSRTPIPEEDPASRSGSVFVSTSGSVLVSAQGRQAGGLEDDLEM
jgi:hypothetical protein